MTEIVIEDAKLKKEIDEILQLYLPDDYYEELRSKIAPLILEWHNKHRNAKH